MSRPIDEARDDSHKSWELAIEEMRRRVFDWRKIERALVDACQMQGHRVSTDMLSDKTCGKINLTALAKHLSDELTSP